MSRLTDEEYAEYHQLLVAWIEADKVLKGMTPANGDASARARGARDALQTFRERHGLDAQEREPEGTSGDLK